MVFYSVLKEIDIAKKTIVGRETYMRNVKLGIKVLAVIKTETERNSGCTFHMPYHGVEVGKSRFGIFRNYSERQ